CIKPDKEMYLPSLYILFLLRFEAVVSVVTHRHTIDALCPQKLSNMTSHNDTTMKTGESILLTDTPLMFSAIFEHSWDNTTDKYFPDCEFDVKALSVRNPQAARGMIIAIRELSFRSNRAGECIDYIVFRGDDAAMGNTNTKICGIANENESYYRLDNYIEIPDGRAKVIIHIEPYDSPWIKLSIKLTFTAVEDCTGLFRLQCQPNQCISASLYSDLIVNCKPPLYCTGLFRLQCQPNQCISTRLYNDMIVNYCTGLFRLHCKPNQCIAASLFDDKIANCKPPSCDDEPEFKTNCYGLFLEPAACTPLSIVAYSRALRRQEPLQRMPPNPSRRRTGRPPMAWYDLVYMNPRPTGNTPRTGHIEPVPPSNETAFNEP
ncbi:hypothetical protein Bhyg_09319, partial [Pseudolycoriella hygida]